MKIDPKFWYLRKQHSHLYPDHEASNAGHMVLPPPEGGFECRVLLHYRVVSDQSDGEDDGNVPVGC